ncbi:UNVERIFIED_CONTAM: putative ribonuclease H protein [Sesamum radiatum]|uniref:Ribonuclease H protein n=1 Tax=Sesamum radiatum TaxID=300843 RepID=A0AAW2IM23_SESRA
MGFIFRQQAPRAPSIVRWRAPSPSWFKLNTDGSSLGNPGLAGAAGIIRDSAGHVHLAYQFALGTGTSVLAELTAVWRGMELALTRSCPLGGGGGCYDGDLALKVPCHGEVGGSTSDYANYRESLAFAEGDDGFKTWPNSFFEEILWLALA